MRFLGILLLLIVGVAVASPSGAAPAANSTSFAGPRAEPSDTLSIGNVLASLNLTATIHADHSDSRALPRLRCLGNPNRQSVAHILTAADELVYKNLFCAMCTQMVAFGNETWGATILSAYGSTTINLFGLKGRTMRCHTVAWAAKHIAEKCQDENQRAGGVYAFAEGELYALVY